MYGVLLRLNLRGDQMKKLDSAICLSTIALAMLMPLATQASNEAGNEVGKAELAQQQPIKQKIAELLKKAEAGDADAQTDLGEAYESGEGLPKDAVKAVDLFRQAAGKGVARAQFRLGRMYARGTGVPKDAVRAADLIKQSAQNDYAKAQAALGAMYAKGEGVKRDKVLAYVWASLALSKGETRAKKTQDSVALTTVLREEAERLKAKWKQGVEVVREKQAAAIPVETVKKPSGM
jgi:TPR repeat protein